MSAITGLLRFGGGVELRDIVRMTTTLRHRGPDGRDHLAFDTIGMGHALMRVNVEDLHEAQPLHDRDSGVMLTADLRLDNREALAEQIGIAPTRLPTMPDSALLLAAYVHWDESFVHHLLGDFAFALWDSRRRVLLLGRDAMGQRGLFYHHTNAFVAFASEVKALWAIEGVPRRLSEAGIGRRMLFPVDHFPGFTIHEGIEALPGGTLLRIDVDNGTASAIPYWSPRAAPEHLDRDEAYYVEAYGRIVEEAIACRVRRLIHRPGLMFSGGFDSGTIAAVAGPTVAAKGHSIVAIASVLDEGERRAVRDARAAVEAFREQPGLDIRYYVRGEDSVFSGIEAHFAATDASVGTPYVREGAYRIAAAAGARLMMDGHGGDYTVNVRAPAMLGRMLARGDILRFAREFRARRRATGRSIRAVLHADVLPALLPLGAIATIHRLRRGFVPLWQTRPIHAGFARSLFARRLIDPSRLRQSTPVHNRWHARWLHLLSKSMVQPPSPAIHAAAHGLDFTRPFHDPRVVELALAIPESLQFKHGLERPLARQVFAGRLPERLLRSGPGNDAEQPDLFRMARQTLPDALEKARQDDRDGRISRYIDLGKVAALMRNVDESRLADHRRLDMATHALTLARFIAWYDRSNE